MADSDPARSRSLGKRRRPREIRGSGLLTPEGVARMRDRQHGPGRIPYLEGRPVPPADRACADVCPRAEPERAAGLQRPMVIQRAMLSNGDAPWRVRRAFFIVHQAPTRLSRTSGDPAARRGVRLGRDIVSACSGMSFVRWSEPLCAGLDARPTGGCGFLSAKRTGHDQKEKQ